jgi:uncharacterized membrane protein YgdD (TMEM256/DUF423 family)
MRLALVCAGLHGAVAVGFGAWAAHGAAAALPAQAVEWVRTASAYQLWHAAALVGVAALSAVRPGRLVLLAAASLGFGTLAFSCSLYAVALGGPVWLVHVTPMGGVLLILGWLLLLVAGVRRPPGRG